MNKQSQAPQTLTAAHSSTKSCWRTRAWSLPGWDTSWPLTRTYSRVGPGEPGPRSRGHLPNCWDRPPRTSVEWSLASWEKSPRNSKGGTVHRRYMLPWPHLASAPSSGNKASFNEARVQEDANCGDEPTKLKRTECAIYPHRHHINCWDGQGSKAHQYMRLALDTHLVTASHDSLTTYSESASSPLGQPTKAATANPVRYAVSPTVPRLENVDHPTTVPRARHHRRSRSSGP
ncbi:hypothetical protein SAMN04487912_105367 [Arthrobacter sp. cf158]|nr:hypothetical protein SAMN04487912_105367 [Arthrobacter sp. cf158]